MDLHVFKVKHYEMRLHDVILYKILGSKNELAPKISPGSIFNVPGQ